MKIDHIAMYVSDLEGAKAFFIHYFGASAGTEYHNSKTGFRSYFLTFEDGARLELMHRPECSSTDHGLYQYGYAHIAISVGSRDKVDLLTKQLIDDGYTLARGPRTTGDGYYESCIFVFDNNLIEITV